MKTMKHILNEGLDKLFETKEVIKESAPDAPLTEKQREIARELRRTLDSIIFQGGADIKDAEVALQDVIERYFPDHEWWEVCDINIFTELLNNKDNLADLRLVPVSIVKSIKPEFLEEEKVVEGEDYGDECEDDKCDEDIGNRVAEYQKWVDYDMKRYGKISGKTMGILKRDGFTVVKDQYGDLEVIPEEKDHASVEESQKGSTKLTEGRRYNKRTFRYDVGDNKYSFYCETEDTRYGFRHLCSMFLRGQEVGDSVKKYYNRTWEMFDYQSAMLAAVADSSVSEEDKKSLKAQIEDGEGIREGCEDKKCNEATKEGNLTRKERIKFITRLTTELSKEPFNYDWDEANDIAIKRADALHPSWRVRWDNDLDKQIKQELEHTVTKDEFEHGDIIREKKCNESDDDDISDDEYYAELEAHIKRIPSYKDDDLKAEYKEFKDSTHEDDKRVEDALFAEMVKRGFIKKTDEGYEYIWGDKVLAYRDLEKAKEKAKEMGLKEAEYGDIGDSLKDGYAYCYWNKSGDRNDTEEVIAYYKFGKNGKARPLTDEEAEAAQEKFELTFDDFGVDESCK